MRTLILIDMIMSDSHSSLAQGQAHPQRYYSVMKCSDLPKIRISVLTLLERVALPP